MNAVLSLSADGTYFVRVSIHDECFIGSGTTIQAACVEVRELVAQQFGDGIRQATVHFVGDHLPNLNTKEGFFDGVWIR